MRWTSPGPPLITLGLPGLRRDGGLPTPDERLTTLSHGIAFLHFTSPPAGPVLGMM